MGRSVPESVFALFVLKLIKYYRAALFDWAVELYNLTIKTARYNVASESL
jgi:hypothetical protein